MTDSSSREQDSLGTLPPSLFTPRSSQTVWKRQCVGNLPNPSTIKVMPADEHSKNRTRGLARGIGASAVVLPFAMLSFGYPQWVLMASQGPCIAIGSEWWVQTGRLVGAVAAVSVTLFALYGMRRGGSARAAGIATIVAAISLFFACAVFGYIMFHFAPGLCT